MGQTRTVEEERASRYGGTYTAFVKEVRCCGQWLRCDRFTVTCDGCGTDYNQSGQALAPREFWGEETGEHWSECY
jgi:hypothetical protein